MVKNPPARAGGAGDLGSVPGLGRSPGEGNGNLLHYSCLENPMDRAWRATVLGLQRVGHNLAIKTVAAATAGSLVSLASLSESGPIEVD